MTGVPPAGFTVQIDGSSKGNPGPAGIGVRILRADGSVTKEISRSIGVNTNNQAEYEALICALKEVESLAPAKVIIRTDSELLFFQMNGKYKVKNPGLRLLHTEATSLLARQPRVRIEIVRRELNHDTDKLAKAGADAGRIRSHLGR